MKTHQFVRSALAMLITLCLSWMLPSISVAQDDWIKIQQSGVLKIGTEGTYPPFSFQSESGKLTGFDVEFAEALAKQLGLKPEFVMTKFDALLAALYSKRIDVVINQVTVTPERKKATALSLSNPYIYSGMQALVRKNSQLKIEQFSDLENKKIGVGLGTNYQAWLNVHLPSVDIHTYDDDSSKYRDLVIGRTDLILVDRLAALDLIKSTHVGLKLLGPVFSSQESAVAIRKQDQALLGAVNNAILALQKNGILSKLSQRWFGEDVTH